MLHPSAMLNFKIASLSVESDFNPLYFDNCNGGLIEYYNLFDERQPGSSKIFCSYLTMQSGIRYDTKNLAWTQRSSNQIRFLSYILNDFMLRKEIRTCNFSMIHGLHIFKADWQWKWQCQWQWQCWQTDHNTTGIWRFWWEIAVHHQCHRVSSAECRVSVECPLSDVECLSSDNECPLSVTR